MIRIGKRRGRDVESMEEVEKIKEKIGEMKNEMIEGIELVKVELKKNKIIEGIVVKKDLDEMNVGKRKMIKNIEKGNSVILKVKIKKRIKIWKGIKDEGKNISKGEKRILDLIRDVRIESKGIEKKIKRMSIEKIKGDLKD